MEQESDTLMINIDRHLSNGQHLTLATTAQKPLRPLIEEAIRNELHVLNVGIRHSQQRIADFEERYGIPTATFLQRYRNDEITETLETIEWVGEWRLLERLREDELVLQGVYFAD
jgi:hypothetical protein